MIKIVLIMISLIMTLHAQQNSQQIEVSADHIFTDQTAGKSLISGNVRIQRGEDRLFADEVVLYFDMQTRKPIQYEAHGKVSFHLMLDDGRMIAGKADQAYFIIASDVYELIGNAFVEEVGTNNIVQGNSIAVSRKNGFLSIEGGKKRPAKIIFLYDHESSKTSNKEHAKDKENPKENIDQASQISKETEDNGSSD